VNTAGIGPMPAAASLFQGADRGHANCGPVPRRGAGRFNDTTFKAFAGRRFNPYIGVELDYIDLGNPEDTIEERRVNADVNGFAPYVVGTLPVGPVELFAKVGDLGDGRSFSGCKRCAEESIL
jgi:hypothetical protein